MENGRNVFRFCGTDSVREAAVGASRIRIPAMIYGFRAGVSRRHPHDVG